MKEIIFVRDGEREEFLNELKGFEKFEEVRGDNSIEFTSFESDNNPAFDLIKEEALVVVGEFEYRIKQVREFIGFKEVFAQNVFFDLITTRQERSFSGYREFDDFLEYIFEGTDWTYSSDVEGEMAISNYGKDNVVKLVDKLCDEFECEYEILPDNHVHFTKEIGEDKGAQYRYGHNVKTLSKFVDTSNLRTVIYGYGADDLEVKYVSPNVEKFGELVAEPVKDERFTIEENFYEYVRKRLIDYPELSIEVDTLELMDKDLGEKVWMIYEPLGIEFQTRILSRRQALKGGYLRTISVIVGTTIPQEMNDIIEDQDDELEEEKRKTEARFEMTDDRISLEVEEFNKSIAGLEVRVGSVEIFAKDLEEDMDARFQLTTEMIEMEVRALNQEIDGVKSDASSNFTILANRISSSVRETKEYTDDEIGKVKSNASSNFDILAGRINAKADYSEVSELGQKINNVEFDMDAMDGRISQKVSSTDYNGETMMALINLTSSSAKIEAKNIELKGAVTVLSELSNDLGNIYAGNIDISNDISVGNNITMKGSSGSVRLPGNNFYLESHRDGDAEIHAYNDLHYTALEHIFNGRVDFSRARALYGVASSDTSGLGFAFNGNDRLYVRIDGRDVGHVTLE